MEELPSAHLNKNIPQVFQPQGTLQNMQGPKQMHAAYIDFCSRTIYQLSYLNDPNNLVNLIYY